MNTNCCTITREKDSFHSGISFQKGAFVVRYGFRDIKINLMKILAPLFNLGTIWARAKVITIRRLPGGRKEENVCLQYVKLKDFLFPQLPGGLFSPCDKWKQLSLPKLLYFPFCLVTYLVVHQWRIIWEPAGTTW